jgi:hypothetical protein
MVAARHDHLFYCTQRGSRSSVSILRAIPAVTFVVLGVAALLARTAHATADSRPPGGMQIPATAKPSRSLVEQKLTSKLLYEIARAKEPLDRSSANRRETGVKIDDRQRALVDIRSAATPELRNQIDTIGGTVVSSVPQYESTVAWIPLLMLEQLATSASVKSIVPAAELALH